MNMSFPVTIIGSGNVAWHLGPALENIGCPVRELYSRQPANAKDLAKLLYDVQIQDHLDFSASESKLFLLAVSDSAIETLAQELILPENAVVAHTSGSVAMDSLRYTATDHYGVFYPLQTFSKGRVVAMEEVPLLIEGNTPTAINLLRALGRGLSGRVVEMDTANRKIVHLAAVFANNFTNHMIKISGDILSAHQLSPDLLYPLISETMNKLMAIGPERSQTGPAKRQDYIAINHHLELLADNEELSEIYTLISQHISDTYSED
jgi:predicted short-subunit dehydrogenase-like oxidoreductase (DUF2520 family)